MGICTSPDRFTMLISWEYSVKYQALPYAVKGAESTHIPTGAGPLDAAGGTAGMHQDTLLLFSCCKEPSWKQPIFIYGYSGFSSHYGHLYKFRCEYDVNVVEV